MARSTGVKVVKNFVCNAILNPIWIPAAQLCNRGRKESWCIPKRTQSNCSEEGKEALGKLENTNPIIRFISSTKGNETKTKLTTAKQPPQNSTSYYGLYSPTSCFPASSCPFGTTYNSKTHTSKPHPGFDIEDLVTWSLWKQNCVTITSLFTPCPLYMYHFQEVTEGKYMEEKCVETLFLVLTLKRRNNKGEIN